MNNDERKPGSAGTVGAGAGAQETESEAARQKQDPPGKRDETDGEGDAARNDAPLTNQDGAGDSGTDQDARR